MTPISVDVGVLERSDRVVVLPGDFGWDDVGTWGALKRVRAHDNAGNATSGNVYAVDARDNVCTPRTRRSCCTACPISWSSSATDWCS